MIMASTSTIMVVGLNAALQKRFVLESPLVPGAVHRASRISTGVGGKGQDAACALTCLESTEDPWSVRLLQFLGTGAAGEELRDILTERFGLSLECTVRTNSGVRTCTSIVGPEAITTELVEPSGIVSSDEFEALLETINPNYTISALCCMGSLPPGCPEDAYTKIYQRILTFSEVPPLSVVDSIAGLESLLKVLVAERTILKLNVAEFCKFLNVHARPDHLEASGCSQPELVVKAIRQFRLLGHSCRIALTDGAHGAYFYDGTALMKFTVPKLPDDTTVFPIGAGDAVAAGLVYAWQRQWEDPFAFGLACGSASCLHEENSVFERDVALDFYKKRLPPEIVPCG